MEEDGRKLEQEAKIQELRAVLSDSEAGRAAAGSLVKGGELSAPEEMLSDQYLRRWLRARRWEVDSATRSIINHAQWRAATMPSGRISPADVANELGSGKAFLLSGSDRSGRPVLLIQARKHSAWTRKIDELQLYCCYLLDLAISAIDPADCTPSGRNPRGQLCVMLDLSDMGMTNMDVQAIQALFKLLGEHYVERLGHMVMFNPPYIFWGAWNTLSPLLPPVTKQKIQVLDVADKGKLVELVDSAVLPAEYGGSAPLPAPIK